MPKYAHIQNDGTILSITNLSAQDAAQNKTVYVAISDNTLNAGDVVDKTTGTLVSRKAVDTQASRQACRELVRQVLRDSDWTQTTDNLGVGKQGQWATYRAAVRTNWATAKATNDPLGNMVWPAAPGDPNDGL